MASEFVLPGLLAMTFYWLTYFIFRKRAHALSLILSRMHEQRKPASYSYLMHWAFKGRGVRKEKFQHLFTIFPPLMLVMTATAVLLVFLTVFGLLKIPTWFGTMMTVLLIALPYYRAADAIEMFMLSRVAERAGLSKLSEDDMKLLEVAEATLVRGFQYFKKLSVLALVILTPVYAFGSLVRPTLDGVLPGLGLGLLPFAGIVSVAFVGAFLRGPTAPSDTAFELEQTREMAPPMAWDHLSYGTVPLLDATVKRLMSKLRPNPPDEHE